MAAYYLATQEGEPLSVVRYPTTEAAYDACVAIYGEGAWNDTVLLCEEEA